MSALFETPAPRVYSIPPSAAFLDTLAQAVWETAGRDPMALTGVTVLLPTRRASREFGEAMRRVAGQAALTPLIRTIGDVDSDAPPFEPGDSAADFPPPVPPGLKRFELARLIAALEQAKGETPDPAAALAAAGELENVLEELAIAEVDDLSKLEDSLPALPAHLQDATHFLEILQTAWPARLEELGYMDSGRRRSALLRALAGRWRDNPPKTPVIAAGSTGSIPATAELLKVVAGLPQGCVVLPGLDADLDDAAWDAIDPQHPQSGLKSLLDRFGAGREAVKTFPGARETGAARRRRRFVNEALRPAEQTQDWLRRLDTLSATENLEPAELARHALDGVELIEADSAEEEAAALALVLREFLEERPASERAILATPDLGLAARVCARMKRWGVEIDSSAGRPLRETPAGAFLNLVLSVAQDPQDPAALAALWKHPLCTLGVTRPQLRELAARVEKRALRGVRPRGRDALKDALTGRKNDDAAWRLVEQTDAALAPLIEETRPAAGHARALAAAVEALSADAETPDVKRAWAGRDGDAAAGLIRDLLNESEALPEMTLEAFARAVSLLSEERSVRERPPEHPRLQIMGPLEARLQQADLMLLAGLNEGTWPTLKRSEPFFSARMRRVLGMDPVEKRIGLSAHDFAQALSAPRVVLSRAKRVDGSPTVASRWVWRLKTLARGALGEGVEAMPPKQDYLDWARRLDTPEMGELVSIPPPEPRPPVSARPRDMAVTSVTKWVRDPYSIYARRILRLNPLETLDQEPGGRERGQAVHHALEIFFNECLSQPLPHDARQRLTAHGVEALNACGLREEHLIAEHPRMARAAAWLITLEEERRNFGYEPVLLETLGEIEIEAPGGPFTLRARADRIDIGPLGPAVIDYKTGGAPGKDEARAGFDPQLALTAFILAKGGFESAPTAARQAPQSLLYLRVRGGRRVGERIELVDGEHPGETLMQDARAGIEKLVRRFDEESTPYLSQPRAKYQNAYGDYDDLARRAEWASRAEGGSE